MPLPFFFWLKATEKVPTSGPTPARYLTTAQHFFNQYLIQEVREVQIGKLRHTELTLCPFNEEQCNYLN